MVEPGGVLFGIRLTLSTQTILVLLCALCIVSEFSEATTVVDVFRMIQYDLAGDPYGSRKASFSLYAAADADVLPLEDLARAIIVMRIQAMDFKLLQDLVDGTRFAGGVLLLFPKSLGLVPGDGGPGAQPSGSASASASADVKEALGLLARAEQMLLNASIAAPVYFAEESAEILRMLEQVKRGEKEGRPASATNGGHKLVVATAEGRKIKNPPLVNLEAWLLGQEPKKDVGGGAAQPSSLPTIAIVASYDTLGVAPALSKGASSTGSSTAALLELLRMFSRLYSRARPRYNLLFVLTSGGAFNFDGTKQWLSQAGPQKLGGIEAAICLHSIGGVPSPEGGALSPEGHSREGKGFELFVHSSKPLSNARVQALVQGLEAAGAVSGVAAVQAVHKKVNMSDAKVPWEHELFARHKVLAVTVSSLPKAPSAYFEASGGVADSRLLVDDGAVLATVKTVAETLGSYLFNFREAEEQSDTPEDGREPTGNAAQENSNSTVEQGSSASAGKGRGGAVEFFPVGSSYAPNRPFLKHWLDFLAEQHRVAPLVGAGAPVIGALQEELSKWADKVESKQATLGPLFTIYSGDSGRLFIYEVASVALDLVLLPSVLVYLALLFVTLHISTKGLDDFIGSFRSAPLRKAKAA